MSTWRKVCCCLFAAVAAFGAFGETYYVTPTGGGDGSSWADATTIADAIGKAAENDTLLLKAGEYRVDAQVVIATSLTVKGGYAGTDDVTLDASEPMSWLNAYDNSAFQSMVSVTTASGEGNQFERICFTRGYVRGLNKTGAADISFKNCRFYQNGGLYNPNGGFSGVGANLTGTSAVEARFEDCVFDYNARTNYPGNRNTCMQGAGFYATGFKRVYVDNCLFATNCGIMGITHEYGQDRGDGGGAIWANAQPMTVRNTRFIANNTPGRSYGSDRGGTVRITGASGGTAFSNCTFVANCCKYSSGYTALGAPISIQSANTSDFYDIEGCTFAYNVTAGSTSSAGLTVDKGTAKVRNSIFYGNKAVGISAHYGREIAVHASGVLDIDYSLLTGSDDSYISSSTAANLILGDHMVYGDPLFGTTLAQANALKNGDYYNVKKYAELMAIDIHENALGEGYSRAIDTGTGDFTNEPTPNGGVRNLGVYGNTTEAAVSSALGTPALTADGVAVAFAADTKPTVTVTPGGGVNYNAHILIEIADTDPDGGSFAGWTERAVFSAVQTGESVTLSGADLHQPGDSLYVRVTVEYPGMAAPLVVSKTATVSGDLPFYYGHGGGPGVIHVREGAAGKKDGSDWTDAFDSIDAALALAAADATKTNIWVAGTIVTEIAPGSRSPAAAELTIRGGFHGDEDSLADRASGTYATLDGNSAYNMVSINNAEGHDIVIEDLIFTRSIGTAMTKAGKGGLTLRNCQFLSNGVGSSDPNGRALNLSGSSAANVHVTNCVFRGNVKRNGGSSHCAGTAIYATSLKRLTIDDSLFVTNGASPSCGLGEGFAGRDTTGNDGQCLYLNSAPVTVRNCDFRSNRGGSRMGNGGIVLLLNNCGGSSFTNCTFAGHQSNFTTSDANRAGQDTSLRGGVIVLELSKMTDTVDFEHCTIAYNLVDIKKAAAGLTVVKGTANVHNSIIYGNVSGSTGLVGADIAAHENGRVNLSYVRLTEEEPGTGRPTVATVSEATADSITYDNVSFGDPTFATPRSEVQAKVLTTGQSTYFDYSAVGIAFFSSVDVHLCSPAGMRLNDGMWKTDEIRLSDAIDKGDPDSPFVNEPQPNGDRANLGAYGNTKDASCSAKAQPEIGDVTVSIPNGFARPLVTVPMVGNGVYFADVAIYVESTGGYSTTYRASGVLNGTVLEVFSRRCYSIGSTISWRVEVSAEGADDRTANGVMVVPNDLVIPAWDGKGGNPEKVVHVWPEAVGGNRDGYSWWDGCATIADALAQVTEDKNEIWVIGGTNTELSVVLADWNKKFPVAIRGGFAATDCSPEDRQPGARTVLDGSNTVATVASVNNIAALTLDGFDFVNGLQRGFNKSGTGDIALLNCGFRNNGAKLSTLNERGSGAYLTGSSSASAVIANCRFEGNVMRSGAPNANNFGLGGALCVTTFNSLELVGTQFLTNGVAPEADTGNNTLGRDGFKGSAVYVKGVPVTMRDCEFRGNRGTCREGERGGCVRLEGACGGSVIDHCLWLGNYELTGWNTRQDSTCSGALVLNLDAAASAVTVRNSTIAYNLSGYYTAAAGISVAKGTLNLEDSIVFGNRLASGATVGSDLALTTADGSANVSYTLFTSNDTAWVSGGATALVKGDGVRYGDPLFVTDYTNAMAKVKSWSFDAMRYDAAKLDEVVGFDAHLRSKAGYWTNGGAFVEGDTVTSPAIDNGNPNSDYKLEPSPNGLCVNMGRYGNTTNASLSVVGQPEIASIEAACVGDYTQPRVTVTLGAASADVDYKATVEVIISTNGVEVVRGSESGIANGGSFVFSPVAYLAEGTTYDVSVRVTAVEAEDRQDEKKDVPVTGRYPEWIGHGGGEGVLHVWTGAPGNCTGSDWHNACHTWNEAVTAYVATPGIREIWFIDIAKGVANAAKLTTAGDLTLRGGFANTNDSLDERTAGARSVLDGFNIYGFIKVENETGRKLSVERLVFCNSSDQGFVKTGEGDVEFEDCDFLNNYKDRGAIANGRGLHVTGAAGVTRATLRRCTFEGNGMFKGGSYLLGYGAGAYFANCARVTIDDSLFRTNGITLLKSGTSSYGSDVAQGSAIYATSAPITVRNTKFISNHGTCRRNSYNNGGAVRLEGACGGSVFTNCLFVGNSDRCGWGGEQGYHGGAIVLTMSDAAAAAEFVNCTIAYNLADGKTCPGGINVYKGTVNLKNSIVFGNVAGGYTAGCGREVDVKEGAFNAEDCLFADLTTNTVQAQAGGTTNFVRCITGDPLFVTPFTNVTAKITNYGKANNYWYFTANEATRTYLTTLNVHLRGGTGYADETTGETVTAYRRKGSSPAIDAGDPASDCSNEASPNGNRVNLGFYGNTPWATMSKNGLLIFVK